MKTIALTTNTQRLWLPLITALLLTLLLLTACSNNEVYNQSKIYAPAKTTSATALPANQDTARDFAYSYTQESQTQVAPYTSPQTTDAGNSSSKALPATKEKADAKNLFYIADKPTQVFKIDNTNDVVITGKAGIKIFFPAGCLDVANAAMPVTVQLREYTTIADMVLANLTTTSNGELIETGGTVMIKATDANGNEVGVKAGQQIQLAFPTAKVMPGMQTFYGDAAANGSVNWVPQNGITSSYTASPFLFVDERRADYMTDTLVAENFTVYSPNTYYNTCEGGVIVNRFLEAFKTNLHFDDSLVSLTDGSYHFDISLQINQDARIRNLIIKRKFLLRDTLGRKEEKAITVERRKIKKQLRNIIISVLKNLSPQDTATFNDREAKFKVRIFKTDSTVTIRSINAGVVKYYRANTEVTAGQYNMPSARFYTNAMQNNAEFYLLYSGQLGWINCDRYPQTPGEKKNIYVRIDEPKGNYSIKAIFKDVKSLADVYEYDPVTKSSYLKNVSTGLNIKFLVMKTENDKRYFAVQDINTKDTQQLTIQNFKPFTLDAIQEELASLN